LYRMDEHGHGRLGDGGEVIGDVLLTCVDGRQHGKEFWLRSALASSRVELGLVRERSGPLRTGKTSSCRRTENIGF
jgi:hypothetical protein